MLQLVFGELCHIIRLKRPLARCPPDAQTLTKRKRRKTDYHLICLNKHSRQLSIITLNNCIFVTDKYAIVSKS